MADLEELAGRVEVLSLGYTEPPIEATRRRWYEALKPFPLKAHQHAAVLAAHNWDALLIGDRVFLYQTKYGGEFGHWINRDGTHEDANAAEMEALYGAKENGSAPRLFRARTQGNPNG